MATSLLLGIRMAFTKTLRRICDLYDRMACILLSVVSAKMHRDQPLRRWSGRDTAKLLGTSAFAYEHSLVQMGIGDSKCWRCSSEASNVRVRSRAAFRDPCVPIPIPWFCHPFATIVSPFSMGLSSMWTPTPPTPPIS